MIYKKRQYQPELVVAGCYLAGGSILSLKTGKPIKDYDLYPKDQTKIIDIIQDLLENHNCYVIAESDRSVTLKSNSMLDEDGSRMIVQVITIQDFPTPESIFETFDFTVCMGAYDCDSKTFHYHESFWVDIASNVLNFNSNTKYPYASLVRTKKYTQRGFHLPKGELLKIAMTIANMGLPSGWKDLAQQIGGVYGNTIELNTDGMDFNFENVIKVLSETDFRFNLSAVDTSSESAISKVYKNMDTYEKYLIRSECMKLGRVEVVRLEPYDFVLYNGTVTNYFINTDYIPEGTTIPYDPKNKEHSYEIPERMLKVLDGIGIDKKDVVLTGCIATKGMFDETEIFLKRYQKSCTVDGKYVNPKTVNEFIPNGNDVIVTVFANLGDAIEQMQEIDPNGEYRYEKFKFKSSDVIKGHSHNMFNVRKSKLEVI